MAEFVRAAAASDIPLGGGRLFRHGDKRIALLRTSRGVYAADNRCPHQGYALVQGDVSGDVLTCAWHNWKFRLTDGECVFGGENIRTYPVEIRGGDVFIDVTDPAPETIAPQLFSSLLDAMGDVDVGRLARDAMRLRRIGTPLAELVREGVRYGAERAEYGWNHSLATLADCLTMAAAFEGPLRTLPVIQGLSVVSQTEVRRPARPRPEPVDPRTYGGVADGLSAFPGLVEEERGDDAEALLCGLLAAGATPADVRRAFLTTITNHFLGYGHPMIYCQKAFELLDRIGWSEAETVLGPLVPAITLSTRYDRLPYMRRFLAAWRAAEPDMSQLFEIQWTSTAGTDHADLRALRRTLLDGSPDDAVSQVLACLGAGVPVPAIIDAISAVAAARLGRFDVDLDTDDASDAGWLDVTHTLTYTSALRWAWSADPSPEVLRGLMHAAWFVQWTGRFDAKNAADAAPVPARAGSDAGAVLAAIRKRDPDQAVAVIKGYDGPAGPLEAALTQAAAEDNSTAPIMVAHAVKTTMAAIGESRSRDGVGGGAPADRTEPGRAPLAAVGRFLAAPKRERFVYQSTLDAIAFIQGRAKGDTEPE
jgi:nitrite reductase/ring-hydroxylating ferredoxin subunit